MIHKAFVVCDSSGNILRNGFCTPDMIPIQASSQGETAFEVPNTGVSSATHYVDLSTPEAPVLVEKIPMPYTIVGNQITNLPIPCRALYKDVVYDITDGVIIVPGIPGDHVYYVAALAYLSTQIIVTI